jgi:hypothetical protein
LLEEQEFGQTGDSFERFRLLEARDLLRDRTEATQQAIEEEGQRLDRIAKKLDGIESVLDQIEFYCAHRGDDTPTSPVREDALRIEELDEAIAPLQTKADELDIQIMEAMRRQKQSLS